MRNRLWIRQFLDRGFQAVVILLALLTVLPLFLILGYVLKNGLGAMNWELLTHLPKPVGETGGGLLHALVGTLMLVSLALLFSVPLGILAGIYLAEHQHTRLSYWMSLCIDILQGIPSIVIGIIAYIWVVMPLHHFSALSGGVALAIMMLPMTVKATEETLKRIPRALKEAALALGAPYHTTILQVVLPAGLSGIMTGILLGVARIAGETAPLLFTAFGSPFLNFSPLRPVDALPLLIFNYAMSPYPDWHRIAWGASVLLIAMVLGLNLLARWVIRRWKVQF